MIDSDDVMHRAADLREALDVLVYRLRMVETGVTATFFDRWQSFYDDMARMKTKVEDLSSLPPPEEVAVERPSVPIYL